MTTDAIPKSLRPRGAETLAALVLAAFAVGIRPTAGAETIIHPPLGPYIHLTEAHFQGVPSFSATNRLVLTPYFYWYDDRTQAHLIDADGTDALTDHPPTLEDFSYRSVRWHESQLRDMMAAGIDVVLPVYWGAPSERTEGRPVSDQAWSYSGLPPLVAAREALVQAGQRPPRIGLFYDTSTLRYNREGRRIDLTTDFGRAWFYESVRDFFSLIPPAHWAMIDGKPIVFLYSANFASAHDQTCIDHLKGAFARDFGGHEPFVVREISWNVESENVYAWGGALGLKNPGVASLGPGYDHSAVPGREPLVVDREGGAFFERNWARFLRRPSNLVMIETWNEFHEGTDIAASREYGRQYLELNRRYADWFKQGYVPPLPRGPYSDVRAVWVELGPANVNHGVTQVESADGVTAPAEVAGRPCRAVQRTPYAGRYVYFRVDDSFKWADEMLLDLRVDYFDHAGGRFTVEYDGSDPNAPFQGAYTRAGKTVNLTGTRTWKTARFRLSRARLLNSENAGADFRLVVEAENFHVARVEVSRLGVPTEAGARLPGKQPSLAPPEPAEWQWVGGDAGAASGEHGWLRLNGGEAPVPEALLRSPESVGAGEEWLIRARLRGSGAGMGQGSGIVIADPDSGEPRCFLRWLASPERGLRLDLPNRQRSAFAVFPWRPNTWYWVRFRHASNAITHYPDLCARVWPADGETLEPLDWTLYLDYHPADEPLTGRFGFRVAEDQDAVWECDFLLVKTGDAPEITVNLPALPPPWLELRASAFPPGGGGFQVHLAGAPNGLYTIERSNNLAVWEPASPALQADAEGRATWFESLSEERRFAAYRARASD